MNYQHAEHIDFATAPILLACGFGAVLVGMGAYRAWRTRELMRHKHRAEATVLHETPATISIDFAPRTVDGVYLDFSFRTANGHEYFGMTTMGFTPGRFKVGQKIQVAYPQGHPEQAQMVNFKETYGFAVLASAWGTAMLAGGLIALILTRSAPQPPPPPPNPPPPAKPLRPAPTH